MQSDIDKKLISALDDLPEGYWDFKEADTKEFTHGIHNYPAMMVSPISRNIIRLMKRIKKIDALFDPFAGWNRKHTPHLNSEINGKKSRSAQGAGERNELP